ncbi:MAG: HAD family hydrolase [Ferroplasma sp.]
MMEIVEIKNKGYTNYLKGIKLIVFDMDGVLLKNRNSWDVIIRKSLGMHSNDRNSMKYTFDRLYKQGIPEYMFENLDATRIKTYLNLNELSSNVKLTMDYLKEKQIKTAIVSAGSHVFAEYLSEIFGFDYYIGNHVDTNARKFIKNVDPEYKDINVRHIQEMYKIKANETLSVGDSYMDLSMKRSSKYFIAFNPSSNEMLEKSDFSVNSTNLFEIIETLVGGNLQLSYQGL